MPKNGKCLDKQDQIMIGFPEWVKRVKIETSTPSDGTPQQPNYTIRNQYST